MKDSITNNKSISAIDQLRGIASFSVCMYHIICTTIGFIHTPWILSLFSYGKFGVQVFFVISGFVIPYSLIKGGYNLKSMHLFLFKRFIRIEPPYVFAIIVALIYVYVREYIPGTNDINIKPTTRDLLLHFGYLIPFFENAKWLNDVFWTLAVEFQYYLLISILIPIFIHKLIYIRLLGYALIYMLGFFIMDARFITFWGPLFLIGISYCLFYFEKIKLIEFILIQIPSIAFIYLYINVESLIFGYCTLLIIIIYPNFKTKITNYLGQISYSLYLIHCLSGVLFVNLASHFVDSIPMKLLVIIGGILISIISAQVMYILIEKPSKMYSSKIKL